MNKYYTDGQPRYSHNEAVKIAKKKKIKIDFYEKPDSPSPSANEIVKKPHTRYCWHCTRKFQGNHFAELWIDGAIRELHKGCRDLIVLGEFPQYNLNKWSDLL